jgi:hypothetical protein
MNTRACTPSSADELSPESFNALPRISEIGARLGVEHSLADLPHHFTLSLFKDCRVQRDCEVVWSDKRFVAVKFTEQRPLV